jgi:DNA-binding response OmpR family regulator
MYMRVLVVENDVNLGPFLKKGIEKEGHSAEWLSDPEAALEYSAEEQPDLVILDLGPTGRDCLEVLEELSARGSDAAILVLTGRNDLQARIQCLDNGADDCILKPFSFLEFIARCRALLRRRSQSGNSILRYGELQLHRVTRQVLCAGTEVVLTAKEFSLLEYLMLHRGESVSRTELLEHVWKSECNAGTNIVDVYINYLRRKLERGEVLPERKLIQTVRGTGYRVGGAPQKSRAALRQAFTPAASAPATPSGFSPNAC